MGVKVLFLTHSFASNISPKGLKDRQILWILTYKIRNLVMLQKLNRQVKIFLRIWIISYWKFELVRQHFFLVSNAWQPVISSTDKVHSDFSFVIYKILFIKIKYVKGVYIKWRKWVSFIKYSKYSKRVKHSRTAEQFSLKKDFQTKSWIKSESISNILGKCSIQVKTSSDLTFFRQAKKAPLTNFRWVWRDAQTIVYLNWLSLLMQNKRHNRQI